MYFSSILWEGLFEPFVILFLAIHQLEAIYHPVLIILEDVTEKSISVLVNEQDAYYHEIGHLTTILA